MNVTLHHYDVKRPVEIHVNASLRGLGAALVQDGKPVAFASKALTPTEQRYANIEHANCWQLFLVLNVFTPMSLDAPFQSSQTTNHLNRSNRRPWLMHQHASSGCYCVYRDMIAPLYTALERRCYWLTPSPDMLHSTQAR